MIKALTLGLIMGAVIGMIFGAMLMVVLMAGKAIRMSEVKSKPCPFCGAKPSLLINSSAERIYVKIKCSRCNVERLDIIAGLCTWDELECCKDRALEKWNTRYIENPSEINDNVPNSGENNSCSNFTF